MSLARPARPRAQKNDGVIILPCSPFILNCFSLCFILSFTLLSVLASNSLWRTEGVIIYYLSFGKAQVSEFCDAPFLFPD